MCNRNFTWEPVSTHSPSGKLLCSSELKERKFYSSWFQSVWEQWCKLLILCKVGDS
jgi:hypothetical protein